MSGVDMVHHDLIVIAVDAVETGVVAVLSVMILAMRVTMVLAMRVTMVLTMLTTGAVTTHVSS